MCYNICMKKEVIVYNGKNYTRYPDSNKRSLREYYYHSFTGRTETLHTSIWKDHYGPVPKGYIIHHKDGNPQNNDISNLECITQKEHMRRHWEDEAWAKERRAICSVAQLQRKRSRCVCQYCGAEFLSPFPERARFCSRKCIERNRLKNRVYSYQKICAKCGKEFGTSSWARKHCYDCQKENHKAGVHNI